jgi:sigma-B regulation protein RsbU (phosphoserine phosphatase)
MKDLSDCRILVVDDARTNIDILVEALKADYKLSVALSGEGALKTINRTPPDLVLLDIMMPGLDGYEVCRRVRAAPSSRDIPIMFLSALEDVKDKAKGFEAGGNDYLSKPFEILEVKARVKSLLKAKAYSDAVKEQLASELRIAREIQLGILPADLAGTTQGTGLEVKAFIEPAKEVGGDLYEVLRRSDGKVLILIGDVSGKGIPAALFMGVTMTLVRTIGRQLESPDVVLAQVNDALAAQNPRNMFATLLCMLYSPPDHTLQYASAGHPPPILIRGKQATIAPVEPGLVAGAMPGLRLTCQSILLESGDRLLLYTDGVTEAFNEAKELLGEVRLLDQLSRDAGLTASEVVECALAAVRRHAGQQPQSDDIAMVGLRVSSPP